MREVLIRADNNKTMGAGHLIRCGALASILINYYKVSFYCREITAAMESTLSKSYPVTNISNESEFLSVVKKGSVVILDGYHFDSSLENLIKAKEAWLIVIDDLHDRMRMADIIINYAPQVSTDQYPYLPADKLALGIEYILLRPCFLKQAAIQRKITKVESILICFGGSDKLGLSLRALKIAMEIKSINKITVVEGFSQRDKEIHNITQKNPGRVRHFYSISEVEMRNVMLEADIAVVSSSSVLFEAISCSCIPIICYYTKNQEELHDYMHHHIGIASFGDNTSAFHGTKLKEQLRIVKPVVNEKVNTIRKRISTSGMNYINLFNSLD